MDKSANAEQMNVWVKFQIPADPLLEGMIVNGSLATSINYADVQNQIYFTITSEKIAKFVSIKIFSSENVKAFNELTEQTNARLDAFRFQSTIIYFVVLGCTFFVAILLAPAPKKKRL